jgi:hypothetical protein
MLRLISHRQIDHKCSKEDQSTFDKHNNLLNNNTWSPYSLRYRYRSVLLFGTVVLVWAGGILLAVAEGGSSLVGAGILPDKRVGNLLVVGVDR